MLDVLLSRVKEEIGIDGTTGSNINTVWEYVGNISKDIAEQSNVSVTPLIDDRYKSFLWNYLKIESDLEFYEDRAPLALANNGSKSEQGPSENKTAENDVSLEETASMDDAGQQQEASPPSVIRKRKAPPVKKKPTPKKKAKAKPKPKRKTATKKKAYAGGSDDDFEGGSDEESDSESDFEDDLSEESEESEANEESMTEDEDDQPPVSKKKSSKSTQPKKTNPVFATSLSSEARKLNLQPISNIKELSYDQVSNHYGSRLYILGSPKLQHEQLYTGIPPGTTLSINLILVLREIIRHRSKGLYQASITKLLDLDSRSTGHYVKTLEEKGAITRHGVSINKMYTNICVHVRFKVQKENIDMNTVGEDDDDNQIPYNVNCDGKIYSQLMVRNAMIDLAKDAPNHAILAQDVLHGMGFDSTRKTCRKWYNRVIDELCLKGIFKKSDAKVNNLGKIQRCLHLLQIPKDYNLDRTQMSELTPEKIEFPITIKSTENNYPIVHILLDTPLESQCLQFMMAAGTQGVTQRDIGFALNLDELRTMYKILEKMVGLKGIGANRFGAVRHLEFEGRLKRFRYYTVAAYKKKTEDIDIVPEPLPESEFDESKLYESNYFLESPHTIKELNRHIAQAKSGGSNRNTLSVMGLKPTRKDGPKKPPNKDSTISDTSKKRGRPKGDGSSSKTKKSKQNDTVSSSGANETNNSTTSDQLSASTLATMDVDQSAGTPQPAPKPLLACPAKPQTTRKNTQSLLNMTGTIASRPKVRQTTLLQTTKVNTHTTRPTKRGPFSKVIESNEPAPREAIETATKSASKATLKTHTSAAPNKSAPNKSAPNKASKVTSKTVSSASKDQQPSRPLRKRTIADYFAKVGGTRAAVRVSEESIPEGESDIASVNKTSSTSSKEIQESAETESASATSNESILADVDSQASTELIPIELEGNDKITTPTLASSTIQYQLEPRVVIERIKAPVPSSSTDTELEPKVVIERIKEPVPSSSSDNELEPMDSTESVSEPASSGTLSEQTSTETTSPEPIRIDTTGTDGDTSMEATGNTASEESTSAESLASDSNAPDVDTTKQKCSNHVLPTTMTTRSSKTGKQPLFNFAHRKPQINMYLETRIKVLLAILEDYPIVELGKELHDAYDQKALQMNCSTKTSVCNKTLWRTSQELAKRNMAQVTIAKIPMLNSKITERKLLLRNDVDIKGDQYKNYVRDMEDRRALHVAYTQPKELDTMMVPVERLNERLHRMRQEVESLSSQGEYTKARTLEKRIEELSTNLDKFGREQSNPKSTSFWMITALQYGWINALMVRAKIFHSFIFGLLDRGAPGTYPEENIVTVKGLINNMPLSILCRTVGLTNPDENTLAYMRNPSNGSVIFSDLPEKIRHGIFCANNKFLAKLRASLKLLVYIGVLSPIFPESDGPARRDTEDKYSTKILSYKVNDKITIRIRKKKGQPIFRVCEIKSPENLSFYWNEFQYASINSELQRLPEEEIEPLPEDPVERELFITVTSNRNWSNNTVMSRTQRKILNSYVDKDKRTTPLDDAATCRHIAQITEIPLASVRNYYEKVQAVMSRRSLVNEMKLLKRRIAPLQRRRRAPGETMFNGRRIISLKSTRAFHPREYKTRIQGLSVAAPDSEVQRQKAIDEKHRKGELLYMDNMEDLPVLPDDSTGLLRLPRTKRTVWTVQEEELLIYVHIILRHRTRNKFYWAAANQVFPDRRVGSYRNRFSKLLRIPTFAEQYETSTPLWDKIYREGIASGELEDPHPKENVHFDLLGYVTYFIKKMAENDASKKVFDLPSSLQTFKNIYDESKNDVTSNYYFEDTFHIGKSMSGKMQVLYNQSFTKRNRNPATYDQPWDILEQERNPRVRLANMFRHIILMILMTPTEVFDPYYSYSMLRRFPKDLQEEMTQRMLKEKILIRQRGERPIPGTSLSLSGKFFRTMVGKLPQQMFSQASEYERYLSENDDKTRFSAIYISSGMMACLLNLVSNEKLSVTMANPRKVLADAEKLFVTSKSAKIDLIKFDLDIRKTDNDRDLMKHVPPPEEPHITEMTHAQFEAHLAELLVMQDQFFNELIKEIIELLGAEEGSGLTLYQLKSKLSENYTDDDIKLALHKLCLNNPSLVCRVGYAAVQYVLATFISDWAVVTKELEIIEMDPQENDLGEETQKVVSRKDTILPNLWTDVNGSVTEVVLKECKEIIVDIVLRKPGITEADIYRHLQTALCRKEVRDLLDILVEQRVLKQVQVYVQSEPQKHSIFGKTKQVVCTTTDRIEKLTQTCFWLTTTAHLSIA